MCGIAAIYAYGNGAPAVDTPELLTIRDTMASRGPDGAGVWVSPNNRVGLAHRRLALIGLGDQGAQPMILSPRCNGEAEAPLVVSFNGEIYNYPELRSKLTAAGHRLRSDCDTEILLHLYEEKGDRLVEDLRGMFAFALWDGAREALLLCRDPYGIKPLYWSDDGATTRAASQARSLLAGGRVSHERSLAGLAGFFIFGHVPEPHTCWSAIRTVDAGSTMWVGRDGVHPARRWWSVAATLRAGFESRGREPTQSLIPAVRNAVAAHLLADVEVGVFLSGGVDSAVVAGVAAEHGSVRAVTIGTSSAGGVDEAPLAAATAKYYGLAHVRHDLHDHEMAPFADMILDSMDQPSVDGVNVWLVSRLAAESGLKAVLSGIGGDELVGGYGSFRLIPRWARTASVLSRIPGATIAAGPLLRASRFASHPKARHILEFGDQFERLWLLHRSVFLPTELGVVLGEEVARASLEQLNLDALIAAAVSPEPGSPQLRVAALETNLYLRPQLLRDADWASMAHSVEVRVPFVDQGLLEAVAPDLHGLMKRRNGKQELASAPTCPVPPSVLRRRKAGFTVPMRDLLEHGRGLQSWRRVPELTQPGCPWARRWAYTTADRLELL